MVALGKGVLIAALRSWDHTGWRGGRGDGPLRGRRHLQQARPSGSVCGAVESTERERERMERVKESEREKEREKEKRGKEGSQE